MKFIIIIVFLSGILFSFLPPITFLINFAHDDSFYYIKTAYNFSMGNGSSFDLVNETNGYHPLWFLILSLYFFVLNLFFTFSPELYFRMLVLLSYLICFAALYYVYKILEFNRNKKNSLRQFTLFVPLFLIFIFSRDLGMESQLICLLFVIYCYLKSLELFKEKNYLIGKLIILNLILLTRTDYLFSIIPAIIILDYLTSEMKNKMKFLAWNIISVIMVASAYFIFNKIFYGHFFTVSAEIESSFPELILNQNILSLISYPAFMPQLVKFLFIVLVVIMTLIIFLSGKLKPGLSAMTIFLLGACIGTFIFVFINLCYNSHTLREWYLTFSTFVASFLLVYAFNSSKKLHSLLLIFLTSIFLIYFYVTRIQNQKWDSAYEYAISLKKITTEEDRIFQIDASGIVGFFSERKIINGDGLINSFEYKNYLRNKNLTGYLSEKQIGFYSTYSDEYRLIEDSSGYYIDKTYSNDAWNYPFRFPKDELVYTMPFSYEHTLYKGNGLWYLFRLKN